MSGPAGVTVQAGEPLGALVTVSSGQSLTVDNTTTIASGGKITVEGTFSSDLLVVQSNGQLHAPSGYTNADEIQLGGASARITGISLTNSGLVSGDGRIDAMISNLATGEFRSSTSERLVFSATGNVNDGSITTTGGDIEFFQDLTNNGRVNVTGSSALRFGGGLVNTGNVAFSFASASLYGDIANNLGGVVSLAGDSTVTFFGDVANEGSVFVGSGSRAVFAGTTSGSGSFPGGGTLEFVDGFMPGSSPGVVAFGGSVEFGVFSATEIELGGTAAGSEHDQLLIAGSVQLDGRLDLRPIDGYGDPAARGESDEFNLELDKSPNSAAFDYDLAFDSAIALGASTFDVTVGGNTAYSGIGYESIVTDLSRLKFTALDPNKQFAGYSIDNVKFTPEPTSLALLATGLCGPLIRGRRRNRR